MQYPSYNVFDSLLADLYFHWKLFCYFHQLLSYVFSLNVSSVQQQQSL